jgi:arylsulfatase
MTAARNVIFILADQLNWRYLGHAGHAQVRTPHLDRLAAEGARFTDVMCSTPICTPSRVSFLSGQYTHNHLYFGLSGPKPLELPSFLGQCRSRGFHTAALGKIHCPAHWVEEQSDVFHETCRSSVGGRSSAYLDFLGVRAPLEDHLLLPEFGAAGRQSMDARPSQLGFAESQEGWVAAETVRQMEAARGAGKQFAIHTSFPRPHQCTSPSREFWDLYEGASLALSPTADQDPRAAGKAPHFVDSSDTWRRGAWALLEPRNFAAARMRKLRGYLAAISQVDAAVGLILEHLRASGLERETLVIFSSDHGEYGGSFGIIEKSPGICGDEVTRVPLLMRGPGIAPGTVVSELVHAVDVAPTICSRLGVDPLATADGQDLSALLRADAGARSRHEVTVSEFAWSKAVRKGRWRLVWYPREMFASVYPQGFGELYDLTADPWERHSLWTSPEHRQVVGDLESSLLEWLITTTRPRTTVGTSRHPSLLAQSRQDFRCLVQADGKIPGSTLHRTADIKYL